MNHHRSVANFDGDFAEAWFDPVLKSLSNFIDIYIRIWRHIFCKYLFNCFVQVSDVDNFIFMQVHNTHQVEQWYAAEFICVQQQFFWCKVYIWNILIVI